VRRRDRNRRQADSTQQTGLNARSAALPLRADLVGELRAWKAIIGGSERVFTVPTGIDRIFKRDLAAAGIPAKDADGRVVDVHALRHTTASYLAAAGVAPRTAQALMRHSDIRLTLGTYSDPQMLDTTAALQALPKMDGPKRAKTASAGAKKLGAQLGVLLGGTGSTDRHPMSSKGRESSRRRREGSNGNHCPKGTYDSRRHRLTPPAKKRAIGFEPTTSSLGIRRSARKSLRRRNLYRVFRPKTRVTTDSQVTENSITSHHQVTTDQVCDQLMSQPSGLAS